MLEADIHTRRFGRSCQQDPSSRSSSVPKAVRRAPNFAAERHSPLSSQQFGFVPHLQVQHGSTLSRDRCRLASARMRHTLHLPVVYATELPFAYLPSWPFPLQGTWINLSFAFHQVPYQASYFGDAMPHVKALKYSRHVFGFGVEPGEWIADKRYYVINDRKPIHDNRTTSVGRQPLKYTLPCSTSKNARIRP